MTDQNQPESNGEWLAPQEPHYAPLTPPTVDEYREYLDEFEISEEQKNELLLALWSIMVSFVDMHFGIDSVQHCLPALKEISLELDSNELEQNKNLLGFNDAAVDAAQEKD